MAPKPRPIAERFWPKVQKSEGCWNWLGALNYKGGYGIIGGTTKGCSPVLAHRLSWEIHNGHPIPSGMHVCHTCDNRRCVNPAHLFIGTRSDNMLDAVAKGRARHCTFTRANHPNAKITPAKLEQLLEQRRNEGVSGMELARRFGISKTLAYLLIQRAAS